MICTEVNEPTAAMSPDTTFAYSENIGESPQCEDAECVQRTFASFFGRRSFICHENGAAHRSLWTLFPFGNLTDVIHPDVWVMSSSPITSTSWFKGQGLLKSGLYPWGQSCVNFYPLSSFELVDSRPNKTEVCCHLRPLNALSLLKYNILPSSSSLFSAFHLPNSGFDVQNSDLCLMI